MRTRLPPALAILGAALLLSSIEAEGKRLFLRPPPVTMKNCRKKNKTKAQGNLPSTACSVSPHFVCSPEVSLLQRNSLLLRFVHFPARRSSSFVFCLIHSVQCCVVSLRLSLRCAVHTATYTAAFREDQLSGRGRRLLPRLRTGSLGALPGALVRGRAHPAALTHLAWPATSVTAQNKRLQQRRLCASVCFVGISAGQADGADK